MNYLYIPTTTLNFNNILSTGSISPAAVYPARGFGYKQFELVEPNPFKNVLLLYDRYPVFTIEDAERDSHPLIFRIRADRLPCELSTPSKRKADPSIYTCVQTIYFDPSSADLYFSNADARQIAIAKAEPSLTTKLVELYHPHFRVLQDGDLDTFEWSNEVMLGITDGGNAATIECCNTDNRINRLKGFACGYILGAYRSIDPKMAVTKSTIRMLRNKASAMLSDPSRAYPDALRQDVELSCSTLEQFFAEADIGTRRFDPKHGDSITIDRDLITEVHDRHDSATRSTQSLVRLVNDYCLTSEFFGQLDEKRIDVALAGAKAIRALVGQQWEGGSYQKYINALLNNIKSGSAFDFNDSNSLAMQSFAAFVLKGDDLERLESFLTAHGIGDFRIAFALWGAMFGFSKIPKTIFNFPFAQGDASYAKAMHYYVYSVVHGILLKDLEQVSPVQQAPAVTRQSRQDAPLLAVLNQLKLALPGCAPWEAKIEELLKANDGLTKRFIKRLKATKVAELGVKLKKGTTKKAVVTFFERAFESQPQNPRQQGTLPQAQPVVFWSDEHAWEVICDAVPAKNHGCVEGTLKWFQGEWQDPNSKYYGWRNEKAKAAIKTKVLEQRTNAEAISAFCSVLEHNEDLRDPALADVRHLLSSKYR
jgi:hypothetical protein